MASSHRQLRGRLMLKFLGLVASLVLVIALFGIARADTNISGTISSNTTLGPTSPNFTQDTVYVVTGTLTVNAGVTLTIQPGVTLRFNSDTGLNVNGVLNAQGAAGPPEQRIRFTRSAASGNWNGMTLSGGEAMFVRTRRAGVSYRIPVSTGHPQLAQNVKRQRSPNDWSLRLIATAGGATDANTYLGVSSQGKGQGVKVEMPPTLIARQDFVETSILERLTL